MMRLFPALLLALGAGLAVPAAAQQNDKELIIYGNDRCPTGTVCVRAPESDRYRIPQTLRSSVADQGDQPGNARAVSVSRADAASGTGSCSAAGPGGTTGCWAQGMKAWRDERHAANAEVANGAQPQ